MPIVFPPTPVLTPQPNQRELDRLRKGTADFIARDPRPIILLRPTFGSNGAGGQVRTGYLSIYEQTMRLIPNGSSTATERRDASGTTYTPTWVLLALWNAEMRVGDEFFMPDGTRAKIVYVQEHRAYQTKGEVVLLGATG